MSDALHAYLTEVNREYQTGIAAEHAYRPALKNAIEAIEPGVIAVNDPRRAEYGAPDYVVIRPRRDGTATLGYIEAKDLNISLGKVERTEQFRRYLDALPNLLLTDYLEFRWYVDGEKTPRQTARLANINRQNKLIADPDGIQNVAVLLQGFLNQQPLPITTPEALAQRLARLAHLIRDVIANILEHGSASEMLLGWRKTFSEVLIAEYDQPDKIGDFADMIAQTLAYGLFSARIMDGSAENFTRAEAQRLIPKTNPFLRKFFEQLSGSDLDDELYVGFVNDLIALLARITPIPQPLSPHAGKGEQRRARSGESDSPSPLTERGLGGEVDLERGLGGEVTPESIFHYAYAVFHNPCYRSRYAEFLKIDYPRLPLPKDRAEFERLAALGAQLVSLHLLEGAPPNPAKFPVAGDNQVDACAPRYEPISERV